MLRTRAHPAVWLLALASACTWPDPDAANLTGIVPARAPQDLDVQVRILGSRFEPLVLVDFDSPRGSRVDDRFEVALVSGANRVALSGVTRISSVELLATLPAGAPPGTYDLQVSCPRGGVATLPDAFVLYADLPPTARLLVNPGSGSARFTLDASESFDAEDPFSALQFRFDSDGNGIWSGWSSVPTHSQSYDGPGAFAAAVEVRDSRGHVASATVVVVPVTTSLDEATPGATPASPGGAGLSLREAMAWAALQPSPPKAITLGAPRTISITGGRLQLDAPGATVVSNPGVVLDFAGLNQPCLTLDGAGQRLVGLTLLSCDSSYVAMTGGSGGSQVAQVTTLPNPARPHWAYGIDADATVAATSRIGPGNDLSGLFIALKVDGANYEVFRNRVHANALGARLSGAAVRVWQNTFTGGVVGPSLVGIGVDVSSGAGPVELLNNVFDGNAGGGLTAAAVASLTVRNNLFTGNGALGMSAQAAGLSHDHNGYFGNAGGDLSSNLTTDPATDLLVDPLYVDATNGDYRLLPASPAIDKGIDTGLDLNGAGAGLFDGLAPDLGANELQ